MPPFIWQAASSLNAPRARLVRFSKSNITNQDAGFNLEMQRLLVGWDCIASQGKATIWTGGLVAHVCVLFSPLMSALLLMQRQYNHRQAALAWASSQPATRGVELRNHQRYIHHPTSVKKKKKVINAALYAMTAM